MAALVLTGLPASRGIAIGQARILEDGDFEVPEFQLDASQVAGEIERYRRAVFAARTELAAIAERVHDQMAAEVREFIEAHLLMLEDAALSEGPLEYIRSRSINAEWALKLTRDNLIAAFEAMDDPYLRSRVDDVDQVVTRIQHALAERPERQLEADGLRESIIVADDLPPAELTQMAQLGVLAFISEGGGPLSHASILARSLGIPYIAGIKQARQMINEGMMLIVDGERGLVLIEPDGERLKRYREKQQEIKRRATALKGLRHQPSITRDGQPVRLCANAETPADLELAVEYGAAAIGLYRSEFLFLSRSAAPSEDEQYEHYREAVRLLEGLPLTIRTLDVGSDKQLPFGQTLDEDNPALGLRGIRFSLKHPELFRTQLKAALRAAVHGPVRLMLPMLVSVGEVLKVRQLLAECIDDLDRAGIRHQARLALGGMIEVPAAAVAAPALMQVLDFASIGTNDLVQYTLAVDRGNEWVSGWYDPLHPAVLRLLSWILDAGRDAGKPVAMCGEMAGEVRYTRLLLALGLTEFSMHPRVLLEVKEAVLGADLAQLQARRAAVLDAPQDALKLLAG